MSDSADDDDGSRLGPLVEAFARALEGTDSERIARARAELLVRNRGTDRAMPKRPRRGLQLIAGDAGADEELRNLKRELGAVLDEIFEGRCPDDPAEARARGKALHQRLLRVMNGLLASAPDRSRLRVVQTSSPDEAI